MIKLRPGNERGYTTLSWLESYHTFSFVDYYDSRHMGFRSLRVINEDRVKPRRGFPFHSHRDMEIISYVLEGALEHQDSTGNGSVIRPGEVQRMSAGTGVVHSEYNPSDKESVHFLQIWILPEKKGLKPSYAQRAIPEEERRGRLRLIASQDDRDGSVIIHQGADLYLTLLDPRQQVTHTLHPGRHAWVQVARGRVRLNNHLLTAGDGAAVSEEEILEISAKDKSEILLFDLA